MKAGDTWILARKATSGALLLAPCALVVAAGPALAQTGQQTPLPGPSAVPGDPSTAIASAPDASGATASPPPGEPDQGVGEIVVTAQKRSENVQNVPISITALGADQLQSAGVTDTQSLRVAVPALNVTTATGGYGLPRIRGIGATGQGPGIENPVAVYVDGVYYGAAFGVLQSLFDTEQVAVLKGPQGTLFGRNATGGLIQIQTLNPSFTLTGKGEVGYSNYDTYNAAGYVSGGLSDTIAVSVSGQYEDRNHGFGKNLFTGNDVQDGKSYAGRAKLLWKPDSDTSVIVSVDGNKRRAAEPAFRNFQLNTLGQNVRGQIIALGGNPQRDIYSDIDPRLSASQWGASLTASRRFGEVTLKSITAYRKTDLSIFFDPDGTTQPRTRISNSQFDKQFTQELNLISNGSGAFAWVLGGFYMWNSAGLNPATVTGTLTFGDNGYSQYTSDIRLNSYAGFAEGTYHLGASTNLIAGIRYTSDHRTGDATSTTYNGNTRVTTSTPTSASETFNKVTWRLSLDHRFLPELLAYASYNRGFRSGSFAPQTNPLAVLNPEVVDAYEVGIKSDLFDRHVRVNLAGYYYNEKNIQLIQVVAGIQNVYNAGGAHIYGVDGDVTWRVTPALRLFGGFNYTHARYTDFANAFLSTPYPLPAGFTLPTGQACLGTFGSPFTQLGGNCLTRGNATGNRLQNTPSFTGSVGVSYDLATGIGKFTPAGNFYYNSGFVATPDERVKQPSYNLVDASVTWTSLSGNLYVRGWVRNLTDAFYRTQLSASNTGDNGTYGNPRTYGGTLGFKF